MAAAPPTGFNDLELVCQAAIFARLPPADAARAACVHPLWRAGAGDDAVWRPHLAADFAATAPAGPDGAPAAGFRAAYAAWRGAYGDVAGPMLARALAAWGGLKAWLREHAPQVLETLNPGATPAQVAEAEAALGHPLPLALRCIYRVHNGQDLQLQQGPAGAPPPRLLLGLFGTLVFYDHVTSNALQPLADVVQQSLLYRSIRPMGARQPLLPAGHVVFARSFRPNDKARGRVRAPAVCVLDCESGDVYLKLPQQDWPLAPPGGEGGACDGLLV
ncbi:SKIP16 [Scenedesmus sp. PABB004]|nr:SKIP16 [Scenedesmus sp. PABB004]